MGEFETKTSLARTAPNLIVDRPRWPAPVESTLLMKACDSGPCRKRRPNDGSSRRESFFADILRAKK